MAQTEDRRSGEPARVVVIGSRGVIGRAALDAFSGAPAGRPPVVGLSSADVDLTGDGAARELAGLLRPADAVVVLSALTPDKGRDAATLVRNVRMADAVDRKSTRLNSRPS